MKIEWSDRAVVTVRRFMADQRGMVEVLAAVEALADDPHPSGAFRWGELYRLRAGAYQIMYSASDDLITRIVEPNRVRHAGLLVAFPQRGGSAVVPRTAESHGTTGEPTPSDFAPWLLTS